MPGQYRIEVSPNNRAGCKGSECKEEKVKIKKGELRFAVLVEIPDRGASWTYRHWGCVTPRQIENLKQAIEDDLDLFDGYDELPEDLQEKMRRALEQGHVDDEDWKGDPEYNRPGMNGSRKRTPKKKATEENGDDQSIASPSKPAPKKRGRPAKEENDEAADEGEPAPKKAKGRARKGKGKKAEEAMEEESKAGINGKDTLAEDENGEETKPAVKKRAQRGGRKKVKAEQQDEGSEVEIENGDGNLKDGMAEEALKYELPNDEEDEPEKAGPAKKSRARGAAKKKKAVKKEVKAEVDEEVDIGEEEEMNPTPEQVDEDEEVTSEVAKVSKGKKKAAGGSEKPTKGKGRKKTGGKAK